MDFFEALGSNSEMESCRGHYTGYWRYKGFLNSTNHWSMDPYNSEHKESIK